MLALLILTIDHASLSRRSTVPTLNRDTSNIWALNTFFPYIAYLVVTFCLPYPLSVSPFVATISCQDSDRFSRYCLSLSFSRYFYFIFREETLQLHEIFFRRKSSLPAARVILQSITYLTAIIYSAATTRELPSPHPSLPGSP